MFANDALLLIGHGSARYPDAGSALLRHAETLRNLGRFARVEAAVLNGSPSVAEALNRLGDNVGESWSLRNHAVRVVPFFMEDGYFSKVAVPRALHAAAPASPRSPSDSHPGSADGQRRDGPSLGPRFVWCPPVGVHDGLAAIIERQALLGCAELQTPSRTAAIIVVGHGSSRSPGRALALHRHASRVAATGLFARVEAACLEESPLVGSVLASLRAHPVVVIGFFANQGGHVRDDVPAAIAAERAASGRPICFHGCVTDDPAMTAIIMDQAAGG